MNDPTQATLDLTSGRYERAIEILAGQFKETVNRETIERLFRDSYTSLSGSRVPSFTLTLAERLTRDRLRALVRLDNRATDTMPSVLFLCVHNAGRSQMAAGWLRHFAADRALVFSGGSEPAEDINSGAVEAMREVGIDITDEFSKPWTEEIVRAADVVVTMGCGDACPVYPGIRYVDWELEDPAGQPIDTVRRIRDDIQQRVRALLDELGVPAAEGRS